MTEPTSTTRRALLSAATATGVLAASAALAAPPTAATANKVASGKPGEFDFLNGEWKIQHRRKPPGATAWDEFNGEATCWSILGGVGSVEELRIPARQFSGMGLRLFDQEKRVWTDFWVNAKSGVLMPPGTTGTFEQGVGVFIADDTDAGQPIKIRGMWDEIAADRCRWQQAVSRDGGKIWDTNWVMAWRRVSSKRSSS
jgi:hypothetical protein